MSFVWKDRVEETTTTTGTGTVTLAGARTQYQAFSSVGNGGQCSYALLSGNGTDWEVGDGTYTSAGNTLSRDTVLDGSSGAGNKISLTGTSFVFLTVPASKVIYLGGPLGTPASVTLTNGTGLSLATGVTGLLPNANLANSTISGIALGSNLAALTATDTTLTFSGSYTGATARSVGLNLGNNNAWTKGQAVTPVALTPGTTVSVDASLSNDFTLTAGQNFTLANPTNLLAGQTLNFWITQDGTGSRVLTFGSQYQAPGGTSSLVLSTAAGAKDLLTCVSDTTSTLTCVLLKAIAH